MLARSDSDVDCLLFLCATFHSAILSFSSVLAVAYNRGPRMDLHAIDVMHDGNEITPPQSVYVTY